MGSTSRRMMMAGVLGAALSAPMLNRGYYQLGAAGRAYSRRAVDLIRGSLVIDMLAPLTIDTDADAYAKPLPPQRVADFRRSGITGFHNAYGLGGPNAHTDALAYMAGWQGYAGRHPELFALVGVAADLDRAKATGRAAVIMGIQNAQHFRTAADVRTFYNLGQRCAQLTYNSQNLIGSGSTDRVDGGISDFGAGIIKAMNEAGMLVDVSHSGDRTTLDAVALSAGPIAYTHSNCRAISGHPRTKTDQAIRALAAKGGVMGITGVRQFVSRTDPTTIRHFVDHIDHVVKLAGVEHVGIGSDADLYGYDDMRPDQYAKLKAGYKESYAFRGKIDVDGFDHPMKVFDLAEELIRRRYSDANITAILGGNFRRLLGDTWK
ncbi:MAG: Putative dipeptidase [uncultured Sphingomonadaceae bacterium]|uniref:Dipeptidase n=1 Tax=uncultured Sphingomonadaceae bacterium TaxID=169976 RepID=A0A6J4RZS0_9SPHN|nr:MAG: Putative dipeptidase [uncultured Sphingomonadaceae bacterium]